MDEWVLAAVQGPPFDFGAVVLLGVALILVGSLIHALVTGRMGSGPESIVRAEDPRRFWRSIWSGIAFILVLFALAAYGFAHRDRLEHGLRLGMPLILLLLLALGLYRGVVFSCSRAEQPGIFWCGIALIVVALGLSLDSSLRELAHLL